MSSTFNDGHAGRESKPGKAESVTRAATSDSSAWSERSGSEQLAPAAPNSKRDAGSVASAVAESPNREDEGTVRKKKRTDPGSRGVANLTPEQLAKKRANDREAQRAIRERTKNQIELLERRIQELTSQQPYQELQVVVRQKEALERELADVRRQLANVVSMLQPLIGNTPELSGATPSSGDQAYSPPSDLPHPALARSMQPVPTGGAPSLPSSESGVPPGRRDDQATRSPSQRQELRDGPVRGRERLGLPYILGSSQIPDETSNARDTSKF